MGGVGGSYMQPIIIILKLGESGSMHAQSVTVPACCFLDLIIK